MFDSKRIRAAFVRTVVRDSGGIPAAVQGMLDMALVERTVTRATVRDISHEAAIEYLDMTPILIIIAVARQSYDKDKGDFRFSVEIQGRDNRNHEDVSGTYPLIGSWRETGLIIAAADGPRSLCSGSACDWYSSHAELDRGQAQRTTTTEIQAPLLNLVAIKERAEALSKAGDVYLLGAAQAEGIAPKPPTLEVADDTVTFLYAAPLILDTMHGRSLRTVDLAFQVRHDPGEQPPDVAPVETGNSNVPPLLRQWLE